MTLPEIDFHQLFNSVPGNYIVLLPNAPRFTIIAISDILLESTAKRREDVIGKDLFTVYPENPNATTATGPYTLRQSLENVLRTKKADAIPITRYDVPNAMGEFEDRYWKSGNRPLLNAEGEIMYILHDTIEVTSQIKAEKKGNSLAAIEQNFNLFLQAPVAVCIVNGPDYIVELANESMLQFIGRTREILKKPLIESLPEAEKQGLIKILDNIRVTSQPISISEFPAEIMIDGIRQLRYFNLVFKPYSPLPVQEEVSSIFCVAHNVTEQVLARKKAERSEQQVRSFIESAPFPIAVYTGKEMTIRFANQALMDTWGKGNDVIGKTYFEVLPELKGKGIAEQLDSVYTTGIPFQARNQRVDLVIDGISRIFYFNYDFTPLFDENGKVYGVMNTAADVSDLNLAHKKMQESENNLRNIILQAPVAMCIFRGKNYFIEVANKNMIEFWGKSADEVLHKPLFDALPEAKNQGYEELMNKVLETGYPFKANELPVVLPRNGVPQTVYINFAYEPIKEHDGSITGIIAMANDVTDQVMARKKIEESIAELQLAVEIADLGNFRVNLENNKGNFSQRVMDWFGFTALELDMQSIFSRIVPEDLPAVTRAIENSCINELNSYHNITYRVVHPLSGETLHLRSFGKTFFNEEGEPYLIIGTIQNVTQQMVYQQQLQNSEAELQKRVFERTQALENLNQELQRSNANLEEFAYAASHDMKEPIRKIQFFSERIRNHLDGKLEPEDARYFDRLELATKRMGTLIDDLLLYSHISRGTHIEEPVDLNQIVSLVLEDLELEIEEKKAVIHTNKLPQIKGNKRQLQQLFQNLIANSLKYTKPGLNPEVWISCNLLPAGETPSNLQHDLLRDFYLISVKDNGIGFDQADADRIFNVFTRLHGNAEYRGTGVGLSIVRKVVENHRGQIVAEGQPGEGAIFNIYLPAESHHSQNTSIL